MKNYETQIAYCEYAISESSHTENEYDIEIKNAKHPLVEKCLKRSKENLLMYKRKLQIYKSKQILFNMQNGVR